MRSQSGILAATIEQFAALRTDAARMLESRWQLAALELKSSVAQLRLLAIALGGCSLAILCGLILLIPLAARRTALWLDWSADSVAMIFGGGAFLIGLIAAVIILRRFRRTFAPLEESLAELEEDLHWLKEWNGPRSDA